MARKVRPLDLDKAVAKILDDYGENVTAATKKAVVTVAKQAQKEIKSKAPVRKHNGGKYQKGWTVTQSRSSRTGIEAVVHNRSRYQLTHLLEKGHVKRGGGRTKPIVHIAPAEEHAIENLRKAVEQIAGKG